MPLTPQDGEAEVLAAQSISEGEARFERWRKISGAIVAPLGFLATWLLCAGSLTPEGRSTAAVLVAVAVLWMTEVVPLPVTAILGPLLCILLGAADAKAVLAPFADPIVFLFIGSFILARAMMIHRLDRRVALAVLSVRWIGGHPVRMLAGVGVVTALVSMWVSNTATAAMVFPIGLGILQTLHQMRGDAGKTSLRDWPYATGMMLMIAYAASIGGIGTPVGSPPNLIAIGLIRSLAHFEISFFRWMALAVPMLVVMAIALFLLLRVLHPVGPLSSGAARDLREYLSRERAVLGRWTRGQVNTLIAFAVALVLWVTPGFLSIVLAKDDPAMRFFESRVPEAAAALVGAILLFVLPVNLREGRFTMTWEEAAKIDWGTILLFGGGLSLGKLMFDTGVAESLGRGVTSLTGAYSLWTLTAVAIGMGILLSEMTSNTSASNMVIPVVIALAQAAQIDPVPPALGACFGASYGFMLPVSVPPNAIVYSSGLVPITKMMRAGILFDLIGFFIILGSLRVLCPLLGLGG
jgi:sodium-dependent dicarboxylate transporter 2/3/5